MAARRTPTATAPQVGESVEKRDIQQGPSLVSLVTARRVPTATAPQARESVGKRDIGHDPNSEGRPSSNEPTKQRKFLVLYSGTDSVGETLRKTYPECTIVNVDNDVASPNVTHCVDILEWNYQLQYKPGEFHTVFASPPCTVFSRMQSLNADSGDKELKFQQGCRLAQKAIEIIQYLQPDEFFLENPVGKLREQVFMKEWGAYRNTTSYCMYGALFRKNTDIWSKFPTELPRCHQDTLCDVKRRTGTHAQGASGGTLWGKPGTPLRELYRLPEGLVISLMKQTEQRNAGKYTDKPARVDPNVAIIAEIQDRLEQLQAFDECEHAGLNARSAKPFIERQKVTLNTNESLFLVKGKVKPRLMTFHLGLKQEGTSEVMTNAMLDSGSTYTIISTQTQELYKLAVSPLDKCINVALADGTIKVMTAKCEATLNFKGGPKKLTFLVLDIKGFDVILGMDFLTEHNPDVNWSTRSIQFRDSKVKTWAEPKGQGVNSLRGVVATINADDFAKEDQKSAAHIMSVEHYTEWFKVCPEVGAYQTIFTDEPGYIAVIIPAEAVVFDGSESPITNRGDSGDSGDSAMYAMAAKDKSTEDSGEKAQKKPATFQEFLDNMTPRLDEDADLTQEHCDKLKALLQSMKSVFDEPTGLPPFGRVEHSIVEYPHTVPPCLNAYRMSPSELRELKTQLDFLMEQGYIRPSNSPYGAPVLFAPKKDGKLRLCLDFRGLNNQTVKDKYPLPRDQDIFDQLQGAKYFTTLDALYGYWQIRMAEDSITKTSIRTPLGSYEFLVMPFGLTNAPSTFQRFMESVLREHLLLYCMVYIDDIIIYSKTAEEHLQHIEAVLKTLMKHKISIKWQKCNYSKLRLDFLGHIVSANGIAPDPKKLQALNDWPTPTSVNEVQQFVGLGNYYRRHVKMFAETIAPLTSLTEATPFEEQWDENCMRAFVKAKEYLVSAEVLALPDPTLPYLVRTDASMFAVGGSLHQVQNGEERVIAYESKKLSATARDWPTHERELFAYFHCFKTWRHYVHGTEVTAQGDHKPLLHIKEQKSLTPKQARWLQFLEMFNMKLDYIPGKLLVGPDGFSRRPDHLNPLLDCSDATYFGHSVEELAIMFAILEVKVEHPETSNTGIITPRVMSMGDAPDAASSAERYNDTDLIGDPGLQVTVGLLKLLKEATREDATFKLVRDKSLIPSRLEHYEILEGILFYRKSPKDKASARIFVPEDMALRYNIIYEHHDTAFQGHFGRIKTAERIRRHFYWPNLEQTVDEYIKSCDKCQRFKYRTHKKPSTSAMYKIPDYPWQVMTMDEKSGLPLTERGNDSVWIFVDKLSKRAHFAPTKHKVTSEQIARIFMETVFKHHGIPEVIISDRDSLFTAAFWKELWGMIGTNLNMSTSNHPETDGQSERIIKILIELLSNFAEANPKKWDEFLGPIEFAYNDSVQSGTGFSPFEIDNGRSPVTPIKMLAFGLLGHRQYYTADEDGLNPKQFLDNLANNIALTRAKLYKAQLSQKLASQKGTVEVHYKPGDFVYMEHPKLYTPSHTSMDPNYVGPYKVVRNISDGVYELDLPFDMRFRHPVVNGRKLKPAMERRRVRFGDIVPSQPEEAATPAKETAVPATAPISVPATAPISEELELKAHHRIRKQSSTEVLDIQVRKKPQEENVMDAMVQLSDLKVGTKGWCSLHRAISQFKYWDIIHDYIQNNNPRRTDHLFQVITKTFGERRFLGYVTEYDALSEFPYRVTFEDGDSSDCTQGELDELLTQTLAFCNPLSQMQFEGTKVDHSYWVFPRRLARLYAKMTRPYELDAFEHHTGQTSKAPRFCSKVNSVFKYDLTGLGLWANLDFDQAYAFLKYFLKCYRRNPSRTSLMVVLPFWPTKRWWALLKFFRLIDLIQRGTEVFKSPVWSPEGIDSNVLVSKGPTRWHTMVLYLGAEYHPERLWKITQGRDKSSNAEYQRLQKVKNFNCTLTGDAAIDSDTIVHLLYKINT